MGFFNLIENKPKQLLVNKNIDALAQVFDAYSFFGDEKHTFNQKIIETFASSNKANDFLAVAISYLGEGAKYRKNAITYFENYLLNPTSQQYFSEWFIYYSLSELYEKEYLFEKAITCLKKVIVLDDSPNFYHYIKIGDILVKIDINKAVQYYKDLKKEKIYSKNKKFFDEAYTKVLEKKEKGYIYRPRKRIK